jgi:hypothetical protein
MINPTGYYISMRVEYYGAKCVLKAGKGPHATLEKEETEKSIHAERHWLMEPRIPRTTFDVVPGKSAANRPRLGGGS